MRVKWKCRHIFADTSQTWSVSETLRNNSNIANGVCFDLKYKFTLRKSGALEGTFAMGFKYWLFSTIAPKLTLKAIRQSVNINLAFQSTQTGVIRSLSDLSNMALNRDVIGHQLCPRHTKWSMNLTNNLQMGCAVL